MRCRGGPGGRGYARPCRRPGRSPGGARPSRKRCWDAEVPECARKRHRRTAFCVAELLLTLGLASFRGLLLRTNVGAVSPAATTGLMAECGHWTRLSVSVEG